MAAACSLVCEDQLLCSICLEVFTDPVTTPCGHNFCKTCIAPHWDSNIKSLCPMCKEPFISKPQLHVNTFISEVAAQFRKSVQIKERCSSEQEEAKAGEVLCDVCAESKLKAVKSCLVCLTSYCEPHLERHQRVSGLKKHKLIDPVEDLEERMCEKHQKPLELFCKTDQTFVCQLCAEKTHKGHRVVCMMDEYEGKKTELKKAEARDQEMIQERRVKMEQIQRAVKLSKEAADMEKASSVQVFTSLIQYLQKSLAQLVGVIEETQTDTEKKAEAFIKELEEEISELEKKISSAQQLSRTEDHFQFLRNFSSPKPPAPATDWSEVKVHASLEGALKEAVAKLEEALKEMKKMSSDAAMKTVQLYAVDVTLDPETANVHLILSDDGTQVRHGDRQNLPDGPKRFSCYAVLGKQGFSSGRFYYEVEVKDKTHWILGVAKGSVSREASSVLTPDYWVLRLTGRNEYGVANPPVPIGLKTKPQKVGVFVSYEEGLVSFYDVGAAALIYSFTGCSFNEKLYPYFNPCRNNGAFNSAPLTICPVRQKEKR